MAEKMIKRASFSLQPEYVNLLAEIAWRERKTMTEELRLMINDKAIKLGLEPVGDLMLEPV